MKKILLTVCTAYLKKIAIILMLLGNHCLATVRFVKPGSAGTAPYTSWATASNDLQAVINQCVAGDDIWVAAGTYIPNRKADATATVTVNNRDNAFVLKNGVRIFGGFAGTETAASQRNFAINITILSGDLGTAGSYADNCYHVVVCAGIVSGTVLNGFFVRYGNANGTGTITVNTIAMGRGSGGGIRINSSSPTITNCVFSANITGNNGGAMVCDDASPAITNCVFSGNTANDGGGMLNVNSSLPAIINCTFSGNNAMVTGGAVRNGNNSSPAISNCIIWANLAAGVADAIYNADAGSVPAVNYSLVQGGYSGTANSNANPLFVNPVAAALAPTLTGDYRLQRCSPAVNVGLNSYVPGGINNDLDFTARIHFGTVDMGAYEKHLAKPDDRGIVYVDSSNLAASGDGSSWLKAITKLADALKEAKANADIKEIWVAKGTYKPIYNADDTYLNSICHTLDRSASFVLVPGVKLYGGFAGGEIDTSERNVAVNKTILSGDIDNTPLNVSNNVYHVMISVAALNKVIDGFIITGGNADGAQPLTVNGQSIIPQSGAGVYNLASSTTLFNNCVIVNNSCLNRGGGVYNHVASSQFINCTFSGNTASDGGGAIHNAFGSHSVISGCYFINNAQTTPLVNGGGAFRNMDNSSATIDNCFFSGNSSGGIGAGIYTSHASSPILISGCYFLNNVSSAYGGGIAISDTSATVSNCKFAGNVAAAYGGGINVAFTANAIIANCAFSGNVGYTGGGVSIERATSDTSQIINCTFSGNKAMQNGGGIAISTMMPVYKTEIKNCIIWNNTAGSAGNEIYSATGFSQVTDCIIKDGYADGINIFNLDPLFVSPQPASAAPTSLGDYHLQACSPALNLGNNIYVPPGLTKDLDSLDRIKYGNVDMGAYEMQTIDLAHTTWKGINSNWNDKINWCGGYIPTGTTNVIVPLTSNQPIINAGFNNEVKNISFANSTSITIANTGSLTIHGTYSNLGSTIINNGSWVMAGSVPGQTFPGTLATVSAMNNLEINNPGGIKFDKSFELTGTLTPTAGNVNVDNATVTLNSDATSTARVATIPSGVAFSYTGTGKFEVERYIPPHRAWRFLTAPLSNATNLTISQAWQEGVSNTSRLLPVNPAPGFGTSITRSNVYNATDGYDEGSTNNASIRYYNGINWSGVPSRTNGTTPGANNGLINDQQGYMLFVRGDRSIQVAGTGVVATATTLRPKGQLKTGPQTIVCNGWTAIGNPYASPINFHKIVLDNPGLPDVFYVWDANLNGSSNVGGWVSYGAYNGMTQTYTVAPLLSGSTFANNKGDISSGSAFMINYTGIITINENHKSTLGDNVLLRPLRQLRINLLVVNADSTESLNDGLAINMNGLSMAGNAEKNANFTENLAVFFENKRYSVQSRQPLHFSDTIFIYSGQMKQRSYVLEINAHELDLPAGCAVYLEDVYLHQYLPVDVNGTTRYAFTITDSGGLSPSRFRILCKGPVSFATIHARLTGNNIAVQWRMKEEFGVSHYEVERSLNGVDFVSIGKRDQPGSYRWIDTAPAAGSYHYRIKAIGRNGKIVMSDMVQVDMPSAHRDIYVYPNPVSGNILHLRMNKVQAGNYKAALSSSAGQLLFKDTWHLQHAFTTKSFLLPANISAGNYQLEICTPSGKSRIITVLIQ